MGLEVSDIRGYLMSCEIEECRVDGLNAHVGPVGRGMVPRDG